MATNSATNESYVAGGAIAVVTGAVPLRFASAAPCRLVDTRNGGGPIQGGTAQSFDFLSSSCNLPASAAAYSLNVTLVPSNGPVGYLTIWPKDQFQPTVSTMNSPDGRVKANAAIVPAGTLGQVSVYVSDTTNVVIDTDGYFAPASSQTYQFYPLTPCRVVDTRGSDAPLGGPYLPGNHTRDFPVLESSCLQGLNPQAYSFNFTVVPHTHGQRLNYLTVWPKGETQPAVSTLNNPTATTVANAAIVPAGAGGDIEVFVTDNTDLIIDVNGYFAAPGQGGLSMYPLSPCRDLDTRNSNGAFTGELTVNVGLGCRVPTSAKAYVFNATVVPSGPLNYLTLWPDGSDRPLASTLNAPDGFITSNMAIVPTNDGSIHAYAAGLTQLILDISGYFAP